MKLFIYSIILTFSTTIFAQKCEYSSNIVDSIGTYKATKDYLMHERIFGNNTELIFFSLENTDGIPSLVVQFIQKSDDFVKINCLDKNSRIYLQLENGKIITLIHKNQTNWGTSIKDQNGNNNRVNTGYFMFLKNSFAALKSSPISLLRVKYGLESQDYILKTNMISEFDKNKYEPSKFFINYLRCIE